MNLTIFHSDKSLTLLGYAQLQQAAIAYCKDKHYPPWRFGGIYGHDNSELGIATWRQGFVLALTEYLSAKVWVHRLQSTADGDQEKFVLYLSEGEAQARQNRPQKPSRNIHSLKILNDDWSLAKKDWHKQPTTPITLAELVASQAGIDEILHRLDDHSVASYSEGDWQALVTTFGAGVEVVWSDMNRGSHYLALASVPNPEGTRSVLLPSTWGVEPDDQSGWGSFGKDLRVDPNRIFSVFDSQHRYRFVTLTVPWQPPGEGAPMAQATWCGTHSYAYLDTFHSDIGIYEASAEPLAVDGHGDWVCDIITQGGRQINEADHKILVNTVDHMGCVVKRAGSNAIRLLGWLPWEYRDCQREDLDAIWQRVKVSWADILGSNERRRPVQDPDTLLWGWIDDQGEIAIAPRFATVWHFHMGVAQASSPEAPELLGLINRSGDWVLAPAWSFLTWSSPRLVIVKNESDEWGAMGLNLDRDGHLIDEPNFAVGLEQGQFWQDAYARDTEAVEHRLNHPWQPDAISREEMITAAIERIQHKRAAKAVQLAKSEASLTRVAGLFDDSTTTRDLMEAGIWFTSVRVLREQDSGIIGIDAGETGTIFTQYPVGLSIFNLSQEAPVQGLQSMPNGVKGIPWSDLCVISINSTNS